MQKPITMLRDEFTENIVKTVNESGLPLFVIEPIVSRLLDEIRTAAKVQAEKELAEYEEYLKKESEVTQKASNGAAAPKERG